MPQVILLFENFSPVGYNRCRIQTAYFLPEPVQIICNNYNGIIYVVYLSVHILEAESQNHSVYQWTFYLILVSHVMFSVWFNWQKFNLAFFIYFLFGSIRTASFLYNHAPEPLPAVHWCIHLASCVRVCQGRFTSVMDVIIIISHICHLFVVYVSQSMFLVTFPENHKSLLLYSFYAYY